MAQGKLKVKAKLPASVKRKNAQKGPASSQRPNCPIAPKKKKLVEANKLKKMVTKTVNRAMEVEMRSRAGEGKKNLSKVEQAVSTYNKGKREAVKNNIVDEKK